MNTDPSRQRTVAIIGVGLIGGSVGMAARARGGRVVGVDRDRACLDEAIRLGAIDSGTTDLAEGVAEAEVAVVCTPVTRIAEDVILAAGHGPASILVTDVGSTKAGIVRDVEEDPTARLVFVGAHPISGSERQGVAHARADLFEGRSCVLTPTAATPPDRLERARGFWSGLGLRVFEVEPDHHDDYLALTSHLPHAVASALASCVPPELFPLAAGAYRDGTRVAASDAALWAGIFLENREPLLEALADFEGQIARLRDLLGAGSAADLAAWWEVGGEIRRRYPAS